MGNALLNLITVSWVVAIIVLVVRYRLGSVIHPLFHVGVAQLVYFTTPPLPEDSLVVAMAHLITYGCMVLGFYTVARRHNLKLTGPRELLLERPMVQIGCIWVTIALMLFVPLSALASGTSVFQIVTTFYTRTAGTGVVVHPFVGVLLVATTKVPFIAILLGRVWLNFTPSVMLRWSWRILFGLQLVLAFASGVRQYFVYVVFFLIMADAYSGFVLGVKLPWLARIRRHMVYAAGGLVLVCGVVFLTAFRQQRFYSLSELLATVAGSGQLGSAATTAASQEINYFLGYTLRQYGPETPYFQSIYAMAVNPVPRYLWPDKPVGFGKTLALAASGSWARARFSLAAGVPGEAYYNARWPGVFLFGYLFGVFFGVLYRCTVNFRNPGAVACILVYVAWITGIVRGDWLSTINLITYQMMSFLVLVSLLRMVFGRPLCVTVRTQPIPDR